VQVVEFAGNAAQIANTIVVAVGKTARIYFIENRMLPPRRVLTFLHAPLKRRADGQKQHKDKQRFEDADWEDMHVNHFLPVK
jgi:hypothetical protein